MSEKHDENLQALSKKRKSFYDFTKDYPSSDYAKMRESRSVKVYDRKQKMKIALGIFLFLMLMIATYFIVYTALDISCLPIK